MQKIALRVGILFTTLATISSIQTASKAAELERGEWRIWFAGIQKVEKVKVSIKTEATSITVEGTPANLGVIFKSQSGKFQPAQKYVGDHLMLTEPVIVTVRRSGKELMKINADKADIQYQKIE